MSPLIGRIAAVILLFGAGCEQKIPPAPQPVAPDRPSQQILAQHVTNAFYVTDDVLSGSRPENDAAFGELADWGVKTIICVDGQWPDVAAAQKRGLRYVHLPVGYGGISDVRAKELAKAVQTLPKPIYLHCHHGKHRGPAAAVVACIGAGTLAPTRADEILKLAGTGEQYQGLYQAARIAQPFDAATLTALDVEFREHSAVPSLTEAMIDIDESWTRLRNLAKSAGPDAIDAAHAALQLREQFTEQLRTSNASQFTSELRTTEQAVVELEQLLRTTTTFDDASRGLLKKVDESCTACHRQFRDNVRQE